ncbi:similar to Saccharomyces cerevisiae YMR209C Putative S-adenosylmethionine-dependent methyltransferase [Maudiozyma saulgeensis]|uniref:Similar to Saccharomyces cerevisiae YMR209C Putative S-adenosylmethionine-dependent methyltransferase n=1 Tax=Maudiozyma saulgeensis TaxID=1789683 RepID=A0A1X7R914_9SACH|nr:similar to Saccharomyces cerevisiae YMR209C Putative S-adenosylmethionine-dependent methyltransferase [Kazachstania saulgeensis]
MDRSVVIVCVTVLMSYLLRSKWFKNLILNYENLTHTSSPININTPGFKLTTHVPKQFQNGGSSNLVTFKDTIASLLSYRSYESNHNDRLMSRLQSLSQDRINTLTEIGYTSKIAQVQNSISSNAIVAENIVNHAMNQIDLQKGGFPQEIDSLRRQTITATLPSKGSQVHRVSEALSHLCRDYNSEFNEREIQPLLNYITRIIDTIPHDNSTLIVVPGAGAGYIPYTLSEKYPKCVVDSIELSGLMYMCQDYTLNNEHSMTSITLRPFAQYYSGQLNKDLQNKEIKLDLLPSKKPNNLTHLWGDFLEYEPRSNSFDEIIVVTAYFIDTSANMFEYMDKIQNMTKYLKSSSAKGIHWINVGPLKYGTQPIVQLTVDEISKYIDLQGWKQDQVEIELNGSGYLTNADSLYQGHYGLYKFHTIVT